MQFILIFDIYFIDKPSSTFFQTKSFLCRAVASFINLYSAICHSWIVLKSASSNMMSANKFLYNEKHELGIFYTSAIDIDLVKETGNNEFIISCLLSTFAKRASYFIFIRY